MTILRLCRTRSESVLISIPGSTRRGETRSECAFDRRGRGLTETANRSVAHRLADLPEKRYLVVARAERSTGDQPGEELLLADGPDATGDALSARLIPEERCDPTEG